MKNKGITDFIEFCKDNDKTAIIYGGKKVSFKKFLADCLKMKSFLHKNIAEEQKALIFVYPYSYLFYVVMYGGFMAGTKLVVIDSFKDKKRVEKMIELALCDYVLEDNVTRFLNFKLPRIKKINVNGYVSCKAEDFDCNSSTVTTFTSGTTGTPKIIERSLDFLLKQEEFIRNNLHVDFSDVVFCGLPMYSVLSVYLGRTTVVSKKANKEVDAVITSIKKVLHMSPNLKIKKCFLGGAILYEKEAERISAIFPNADITYIYGASESALMYKTNLDDYRKDLFSFKDKVEGVEVNIVNRNFEDVGEITVKGKTVISESAHFTGDLGKIINGKLYILGRKKYSLPQRGIYNYVVDEEIRSDNKRVKGAFSFAVDGKMFVIYKGKLTTRSDDYIYRKVAKIPYDIKHKTKLDYAKAIDIVKGEK
mgnify:CR=1 FL=1